MPITTWPTDQPRRAPTDFEILGQVAKCRPDELVNAMGIYSALDGTQRCGTILSIDYRLAYYAGLGVLIREGGGFCRFAEGVRCGPLPSAQGEVRTLRAHSYHTNWGTFTNNRRDPLTDLQIWADNNGNPPDDGVQEWEEGSGGVFIWRLEEVHDG